MVRAFWLGAALERRTEQCRIVGVFRHETDDLFPEYDDTIVCVWRDLLNTMSTRSYQHQGCSISVDCDFSPLLLMLANRRAAMSRFLEDPKNVPDDCWEIFSEQVQCTSTVSICGSNDLSQHGWYAAFFAESHLYDLFLILNLALPGSANFHSAKVYRADEKFHEEIDLSSFYFEEAWISSKKDVWPTLSVLSVESVSQWFQKVRPGFNQLPEGAIERSLFALLHICRSNGRPEDIIWLFYAFESLFETRPGENFSALFDRFCLVLEPPDEIRPRLKKELRRLYDYRSAFVHGGLQVIHPHHREVMDKRVDKQYGDIVTLSLRWTHMLVACLQRLACHGWTELKFQTTLVAR
ncbi:MAG: hypothetical protein ACR65R_18410 [Methylomicrobium sp.]